MSRRPGSRIRDYQIEPANNVRGPVATNPHSPWQLLIEEIRETREISIRDLAKRAHIPSGTLFNWLRSRRGGPSKSIYTPQINKRLAAAIGVKESKLTDAYNRSVGLPAPHPHEKPFAAPAEIPAPLLREEETSFRIEALKRFLHSLEATGKTEFTLQELKFAAAIILNHNPGQST